ncbi:MAG: hypothetical protein PHS14_14555 [Elusimicrobia bacterium]|nr:hypothetical protein [Elusimicrobiota bacterium]
MNVGIVGHEAAKFTPETEAEARRVIRAMLESPDRVLVSGHCHLGGVDIWAEEEADSLGRKKIIHAPKVLCWEGGFKPRNLAIARDSDIVLVVVVAQLPDTFSGMRFESCYHCRERKPPHVKSGGCWTAWQAWKLGKDATWHICGRAP